MAFKEVEPVGPNVWKPEPGNSIIGVLTRRTPADEERDISARYVIENKEGEHLVWGSYTLDERMNMVKIGSIIKITRKEDKPNKIDPKKKLKIFKVEVDDGKPTEESVA